MPPVHSCQSLRRKRQTGGAVEASGLQSGGPSSLALDYFNMLKSVETFFMQMKRGFQISWTGFQDTVAIKGLGVKHLKITRKWILGGRLVGHASLLALLVS